MRLGVYTRSCTTVRSTRPSRSSPRWGSGPCGHDVGSPGWRARRDAPELDRQRLELGRTRRARLPVDVAAPFWSEIDALARDLDVKVALELHPQNLVFNPADIRRLIELTGATNIGVELDASHPFWQQRGSRDRHPQPRPLVFHAAAKDVQINTEIAAIYGVLDNRFRRLSPEEPRTNLGGDEWANECLGAPRRRCSAHRLARHGLSAASTSWHRRRAEGRWFSARRGSSRTNTGRAGSSADPTRPPCLNCRTLCGTS